MERVKEIGERKRRTESDLIELVRDHKRSHSSKPKLAVEPLRPRDHAAILIRELPVRVVIPCVLWLLRHTYHRGFPSAHCVPFVASQVSPRRRTMPYYWFLFRSIFPREWNTLQVYLIARPFGMPITTHNFNW